MAHRTMELIVGNGYENFDGIRRVIIAIANNTVIWQSAIDHGECSVSAFDKWVNDFSRSVNLLDKAQVKKINARYREANLANLKSILPTLEQAAYQRAVSFTIPNLERQK